MAKYLVKKSFCVDLTNSTLCFLKGDEVEVNDVNRDIILTTHREMFEMINGDEIKEETPPEKEEKNLDEKPTEKAKVVKDEKTKTTKTKKGGK